MTSLTFRILCYISFNGFLPRNSHTFTNKTQEAHTTVPVAEDEEQTLTKCIRFSWKHHPGIVTSVPPFSAFMIHRLQFLTCDYPVHELCSTPTCPNKQHKENFSLSSGYILSLKYGLDIASASLLCLYFSADCQRGYSLASLLLSLIPLQMESYGVQQALKSCSATGTNAEDNRKRLHDFKMEEESHLIALFGYFYCPLLQVHAQVSTTCLGGWLDPALVLVLTSKDGKCPN